MRKTVIKNHQLRQKRTMRVRQRYYGTAAKPRMSVHKSNKHIQVQLIDDESHQTLGTTATFAKEYRDTEFGKKSKVAARKLGEHIAKIALEKNVKEVVFDRGRFKYHGILAELADAAREAGLKF